jgi:hypothetical protein
MKKHNLDRQEKKKARALRDLKKNARGKQWQAKDGD